ncbi:MAG TPA: acyl-CoA dehydrogenase family protein [Candidatus Lokiarchaeia archaeon]|nr:acyl-CoA dehydrogenase family protein [Candidatus Lokiarchaeia archaeon]
MPDYMPWWSPKTRKFADECESFVDTVLVPMALKMQENGEDIWSIQWQASKLCIEHGFHPLMVLTEEKFGGLDQGYTGYTILNEEVGRCMLNINPLLTSVFGGGPILLYGTDAQKEEFLVPLMKGEKWASITVTEPDVGNDAAGIQLHGEQDGDEWVLNGWKRFITLAALSDYLMCYANTNPDMKGLHRHLTAFIVDRRSPGITIEKINKLEGDVEMANSVIRFHDVRVPAKNMILDPGDGWTVMTSALNIERMGIAGVVGQGRCLLEVARAYGKRRVQFGEPVSRMEAVQLRMAEIKMRIETSRATIYYLADLLDKGEADMFEFGAKSAAAKIYCTSSLAEIANQCAAICAGDGYTNEYGIYTTIKNALLMQIAGGSNDILRIFIGRNEFIKDIDERFLPRVLRGVTKEEIEDL